MSSLIIVSNRLPVKVTQENDTITYHQSIGGLATGLKSFHENENSIWVGWNGIKEEELKDETKKHIDEELRSKYKCCSVSLTENDIDNYYLGFCNETIWPLFHYFQNMTVFNQDLWESYLAVNKKFLETLKTITKEGDTVWIHDYQLLLLPELLRQEYNKISIGFFLHIPFPSYELFRQLPWREEILLGMTGADLLGFHTFDYARHFISSVRRILSLDVKGQQFIHKDRTVNVDVFPMGIDYKKFNNAIHKDKVISSKNEYQKKTKGSQVVLSVDRLDYTKGIPERLNAVDLFFNNNKEYLEKVTFIMIVAPSRSDVESYTHLLKEIEELISHTNGKYGTIGWTPIIFFYRSFSFDELTALYNLADVLLVTPVRDGMNLVAKEYIASRSDMLGTVIISETAGAANELGESIIVNPNDLEMISEQLKVALEMPKREQVERNSILHKRLERYDIFFWASDFMKKLNSLEDNPTMIKSPALSGDNLRTLCADYTKAQKRLIFLDYDGTLVPFHKTPSKAVIDSELRDILNTIISDNKNIVTIVSGRNKEFLDEQFADFKVNIVANHGLSHKVIKGEWVESEIVQPDWLDEVRPILQLFADQTPGSFIEEKTFSIAWHYRRCDPDLSSLRLTELRETLLDLTNRINVSIMDGNKVLEVKDSNVNKGKGIQPALIEHADADFVLIAGDDNTDEDMFKIASEQSYTIKIGTGFTAASYHLSDSHRFREVLKQLV